MKVRGTTLAAAGIGALFVYAGAMKLAGPGDFAASVHSFRLVPEGWVAPVALAVPLIEVVSGIGVWIAPWRRVHLLSLFLLTLMFLGALVSAGARGLEADCGCFGAWSRSSLELAIARDVLLAGVLGFLYVRSQAAEKEGARA